MIYSNTRARVVNIMLFLISIDYSLPLSIAKCPRKKGKSNEKKVPWSPGFALKEEVANLPPPPALVHRFNTKATPVYTVLSL